MSALYNAYKQDLLDRATAIDIDTDTIHCSLLPAYTFDGTDVFMSDLGVTPVVEQSDAALGSKTVTDGTFDAGDLTYTAVSGAEVTDLAIYKELGALTVDRLIAHIDGFTSVTPNGGDITVTWGANIFAF